MNNGKSILSKTYNNLISNKNVTVISKKPNNVKKILVVVIIIIIVLFVIYLIYVAVTSYKEKANNSPVIINDVIDAYVARPAFVLPQVITGMGHTFSTWIYVKDWNYKFGQYKNILWKGNPPNSSTKSENPTISNIHCPSIWLYPLTNSLKVVTSTSVPEQVESCDIQNIPLMTWVHIVYVLSNRTVDIYINGKLERSCALRGVPTITNDPVYITTGSPQPGYYGKIGKTQYFTRSLLPSDINDLYYKGPLGSKNYQVNFFNNGNLIEIKNANSFASSS